MNHLIRIGLVGALLGVVPLTVAVLARMETSLFLPQAIRFLIASVFVALSSLVWLRKTPRVSLRLLHAALTVGALTFFFSPLLAMYASRTLPSGFVALAFATTPLWFVLLAYGEFELKLPNIFLVALGLSVFLLGTVEAAALRGGVMLPLVSLIVSVVCMASGIWVSKRLFWLHSTLDLVFWSMLFAGLAFALVGLVVGEWDQLVFWKPGYWALTLFLGIFGTGLATYAFRYGNEAYATLLHSAIAVLFPVFLGWLAWHETPANAGTILGVGLVAVGLLRTAIMERSSRWMGLNVHDVLRDGDRLACLVDGEMRMENKEGFRVQLCSLSMGGLGFRSAVRVEAQQNVEVKLPMGSDRGYVCIEGRVAYVEAGTSRDFPWEGGFQFLKISPDRQQSLVEFLARLTRAEEK